jgi:hypothetical protein
VLFLEEQGALLQASPITRMIGIWPGTHGLSDNFDAYMEYLAKIREGREVTEEDKIDSANNTHNGKVARSLGFTETEIRREAAKRIDVYFNKPQPRYLHGQPIMD